MQIDFEAEPPVFQVTPTHFAKTWLLHDMAQEYASNLRKRDEQIRAGKGRSNRNRSITHMLNSWFR